MSAVSDTFLAELLARQHGDLLRAQKGIRTTGRILLARRVLAVEPAAARLEIIPEEFEEGARAHSALAYDRDGTLLRSFEGDSEDPVDEDITGLLESAVPEPETDEWFCFFRHLDSYTLDLPAAASATGE